MITKIEAVKNLPNIEDSDLFKAVDLALWLIIDKNASLTKALQIATKHYSVKAHINKYVRIAIPQEFFDKRSLGNANAVVRHKVAYQHGVSNHMKSIINDR